MSIAFLIPFLNPTKFFFTLSSLCDKVILVHLSPLSFDLYLLPNTVRNDWICSITNVFISYYHLAFYPSLWKFTFIFISRSIPTQFSIFFHLIIMRRCRGLLDIHFWITLFSNVILLRYFFYFKSMVHFIFSF